MTAKVPINERGTAMPGIMVAEALRRNRKMTMTTNAVVSSNSNSTSSTEARMVMVRSLTTLTLTPCGKEAVICGSSACTVSTTLIIFVPGWR